LSTTFRAARSERSYVARSRTAIQNLPTDRQLAFTTFSS